ncbi:hypothetical protein [Dyadobacter sp. CY323]|uniref:hypothetical protein n=1 Tax=Dyadobacter sp. CY323 TaxID=2907302 RepID=UPI001F3DD236|nr:hypothetical protein [Dyadobacter sp. CY323]
MTIPQEEYGFKADLNHYVSATCLEDLTTCLRRIGEATDYKETMAALKELNEYTTWHSDNLDNNEEPRPCHKDGSAYAEMVGE